jgi:hypothetical protein
MNYIIWRYIVVEAYRNPKEKKVVVVVAVAVHTTETPNCT